MARNTILLLITLILLAGISYYSLSKKDAKTEAIREEMRFTVDDAKDIHKIFIADRKKDPVTLTRNGDHWLLNGEYRINPFVINPILDALERMEVHYIPNKLEVEAMMPVMATKGIKVEVYGKNDNELVTFYVGATTQDERGTHLYKEGSETTYVMAMPQAASSVRQIFSVRNDDYKSRVIFRERVGQIESLRVNYPKSPSESFVINKDGSKFNLSPIHSAKKPSNKEVKQDVFERYLTSYRGLSYTSYNNQVSARDSIMRRVPFMEIEMVSTKKDTSTLTLWPKMHDFATPRQAVQADGLVNYWGRNEDNDFGSVQHGAIRGIFASYPAFYEQ